MTRLKTTEEFPFSEQDLRDAAQAVRASMLSSLPEPGACRHRFSARFLRGMEVLCRQERRRA